MPVDITLCVVIPFRHRIRHRPRPRPRRRSSLIANPRSTGYKMFWIGSGRWVGNISSIIPNVPSRSSSSVHTLIHTTGTIDGIWATWRQQKSKQFRKHKSPPFPTAMMLSLPSLGVISQPRYSSAIDLKRAWCPTCTSKRPPRKESRTPISKAFPAKSRSTTSEEKSPA